MKNFSKLDKTASSVILVCATLIGFLIFLQAQAGIQVKTNLPESSMIGPFQKIQFTFSESVNPLIAESLFEIHPNINGTIIWVDSQTMSFIPSEPFQPDTVYVLTLGSGAMTSNNHQLKKELNWEFQVRESWIAYLNPLGDQRSIWVMDVDNNNPPRQLTDSSIRVMGFDVSRDGEFIVFYCLNETGGIDLWRVTRNGESSLLLDCGADRCTMPAISSDGTRVAYSREVAGSGVIDLPYSSPRIWLLDISNGVDGPIYEDQQVLGYKPAWSPDGSQLASYDGLADEIRLLNLKSGEQIILSTGTGGPMTWSPDGSKFIFTDVDQNEGGVRTRVRLADLALNKTYTLVGSEDSMDYGYNSVIWSPVDDSAVLLGMRAGGDDPSQVLWLFNPNRLDGIIIADQPDYSYNSPRWNVWGTALIFQQFKLKGPYKAEIGLWKKGFQESLVLAEGLMPHWFP